MEFVNQRWAIFGLVMLSAVGCAGVVDTNEESSSTGEDPTAPVGTAHDALAPNQILSTVAFNIYTGDDDLRSDSHVYAFVHFNNGWEPSSVDLNQGNRWPDRTWSDWRYLGLPGDTQNQFIAGIMIRWSQGGGGINGDNWNMDAIEVWAADPQGHWSRQVRQDGHPVRRFTGNIKDWWIPWHQ